MSIPNKVPIMYAHLLIPIDYKRRFKNLANNHNMTMINLFKKFVELGESEDET